MSSEQQDLFAAMGGAESGLEVEAPPESGAYTWVPFEGYGRDIAALPPDKRLIWANAALYQNEAVSACPFRSTVAGLNNLCSKRGGGVCSVHASMSGGSTATASIAAICSSRLVSGEVFRELARRILGSTAALSISESPVSERLRETGDKTAIGGRVDWILCDESNPKNLCLIETQPVYMSGPTQAGWLRSLVVAQGEMVPSETRRRPDYKSAAKRLAAQLLNVTSPVGTLSRGRIKTVILVDEYFKANMAPIGEGSPTREVPGIVSAVTSERLSGGELSEAERLEACDAVFAVVTLTSGGLTLRELLYASLDAAIHALNPADDISIPDIEHRVSRLVSEGGKYFEGSRDLKQRIFRLSQ